MAEACRTRFVVALALGLSVACATSDRAAAAAPAATREPVGLDQLVAAAKRAGLRVLESRRLALVTDRPPRTGDGVEELPDVFDQAFATWCKHYGIGEAATGEWRALGCLVVDRERFRAAGLLPHSIPQFPNGFCDRSRFWLMDQSNPAYRRHLLLHEGVHAFTLTLRNLTTPVWYTEGIAEYLATHRLERTADGGPRFVPTPIPARPDDVEQLGRIEEIRGLRAAGEAPSLATVLGQATGEHAAIRDYAASWAAVAMLANHPRYAPAFAALERGALTTDFNARLAALPGWNAEAAGRDFDAFTDGLDYGWDFPRMAIDWTSGPPLADPRQLTIAADRGWQNAGVSLKAGARYAIAAHGRVGLGSVTDEATGLVTPLESEPEGISLEWYRGRPIGRLLVAQWGEAKAGERPRFVVLAEGAAAEFTARFDGPAYLSVNDSPRGLADNTGGYPARLQPAGLH
jgi:hypothetical protein